MATTPVYSFPSPDLPNPADGPAQIKALAQSIESLLTTGTLKMSTGAIEASTPTAGAHPVNLTYLNAHFVIGPAASAPAAGALPDKSFYFGT